ncbi:hypothetical protein V6Z11_A12G041600 [Gossypium hirsutum]
MAHTQRYRAEDMRWPLARSVRGGSGVCTERAWLQEDAGVAGCYDAHKLLGFCPNLGPLGPIAFGLRFNCKWVDSFWF